MMNDTAVTKRYLVASDFDQTLSFNDSGIVLSEVVGIPGFHEKVVGLSKANLVQQGAELAYLLRHDPEFRGVRREHLIEAGKRVRLKNKRRSSRSVFRKRSRWLWFSVLCTFGFATRCRSIGSRGDRSGGSHFWHEA